MTSTTETTMSLSEVFDTAKSILVAAGTSEANAPIASPHQPGVQNVMAFAVLA